MKATEALFESIYPSDGLIIIGLVAQVGTNLNDLCAALENRLDQRGYEVQLVHLSRFLDSKGDSTPDKQKQGTTLRRKTRCQHALALCATAEIHRLRKSEGRSRRAYIIRSLKRPEEVEALRTIYGEAFLALGVHTPRSKRMHYLFDVKGDFDNGKTIDADENDEDFFGQRTRDTFEFCDFYIKGIDPEYFGLERALKLVFGSVFTTPTKEEYAMFMAHGASLRSADLSRQVGAAILNSTDEVVATGANEVPQFGGGQPWPEDRPDIRDFSLLKRDPNIEERNRLVNSFLKLLDGYVSTTTSVQFDLSHDKTVERLLKQSGLLDITEFGRTIHGEMACLLSCLRNGIDVFEATLACTTFPCHNCTRHLLGAGISRVVYIEPYPKSRAQLLYGSSCSFWDDDYDETTGELKSLEASAMRIEPFIGIGPRKYLDLFAMKTISGRRIERKSSSEGLAVSETTQILRNPKWPSSPYGIDERETRGIEQLSALFDIEASIEFPSVAELISSLGGIDSSAPNVFWTENTDSEQLSLSDESRTEETRAEFEERVKGKVHSVPGEVTTRGPSRRKPANKGTT